MLTLSEKIIVAVDGFSSCGKSSYAKLIAKHLQYLYLDSGAMYRAVALYALRKKWISERYINEAEIIHHLDEIQISFRIVDNDNCTFLNNENIEHEIRGVEVSSVVSEISKIPEVRTKLVAIQQALGREKGIVMDGRDIGTIVFPKAEVKIFMKADAGIRAQRRYDELRHKEIDASLDTILQNINDRDYQDIHRTVSPLVKAEDAEVLNNSHMTFEDQMKWFYELIKRKGLLAEE